MINCNGLVSVIIPVYNVASYLRDALDSVVSQTYKNLEIIIVDDGSTDGSGKICDEYSKIDRRIHVIHQSNRGLSNARNTALELISGDMITFIDSDDIYHPDFIRKMMDIMVREEVDLVICKYAIIGKH